MSPGFLSAATHIQEVGGASAPGRPLSVTSYRPKNRKTCKKLKFWLTGIICVTSLIVYYEHSPWKRLKKDNGLLNKPHAAVLSPVKWALFVELIYKVGVNK